MAQFINSAEMEGTYDAITYNVLSTAVVVELEPISIEKRADKQLWIDNDPLTFTITARNTDADPEGLPVTNMIITDTIDTAIAEYVEDSATVTVGTTPITPAPVTYVNGLLTVTLADPVPANATVTVTFQVAKA